MESDPHREEELHPSSDLAECQSVDETSVQLQVKHQDGCQKAHEYGDNVDHVKAMSTLMAD